MSFRLAPKSETVNDIERHTHYAMAATLRYFTEFDKPVFQVPTHNRIDRWRNLCTSLLYFVLRARCRRKKSSRSLSHLLVSFFVILCITEAKH